MGGIEEPKELESYFHNLSMKDKFTKRPTVWELAQAFPDCRDIAVRVVKENDCDKARSFLRITKNTYKDKRLDVDSARAVKIQDIHDFRRARKTSKRIYTCCPFHVDKNPSFIIYTENNSFHCFSCNKGGSVIDFVMHLHGKSFINAVKYLNGQE